MSLAEGRRENAPFTDTDRSRKLPVGWRAVVLTDPMAFLPVLFLGFGVACALGAWVDSATTGFRPEESWREIGAGLGALGALAWVVASARTAAIRRTIEEGRPGVAHVVQSVTVGFWTLLVLSSSRNGLPETRRVWLVSGHRARRLAQGAEIDVFVHPDRPGRMALADLYRE